MDTAVFTGSESSESSSIEPSAPASAVTPKAVAHRWTPRLGAKFCPVSSYFLANYHRLAPATGERGLNAVADGGATRRADGDQQAAGALGARAAREVRLRRPGGAPVRPEPLSPAGALPGARRADGGRRADRQGGLSVEPLAFFVAGALFGHWLTRASASPPGQRLRLRDKR
jgi:hypothetical protein